MERLPITAARELALTGKATTEHPSLWNGSYGLTVDRSYELSDGSILDLACTNGWLYEGRLYTKAEAKELAFKCPQNVHMEWGGGY